jgi:hypothetical protein
MHDYRIDQEPDERTRIVAAIKSRLPAWREDGLSPEAIRAAWRLAEALPVKANASREDASEADPLEAHCRAQIAAAHALAGIPARQKSEAELARDAIPRTPAFDPSARHDREDATETDDPIEAKQRAGIAAAHKLNRVPEDR